MSKYGYSVYGGAKYGLTPKLAYSVEPMDINVVQFDEVYVSWQLPTGTFTRMRVVRNQSGFPETSEDGVIIFEQNSDDGTSLDGRISRSSIYDGLENPTQTPITQGRNIFYRVFLYTSDNVWVRAGQIREVVPSNTGATDKIVNLLPRTITSSTLSPLGVVDPASELYRFLDGVAFSYEQMMTEVQLGRPSHNLELANYSTIPGEVTNVGLTPEPNLPMIRQRALIREAISLYANKGTALGIAGYAEALTGFAPTVTVSKNLMLSVQDSTFYEGTGNWVSEVDTIEATTDMVPSSLDTTYAIDTEYTCKVTATSGNEMSLGLDSPIGKGVPVLPSTDYVFYSEIKCPATGGITATIEYYDKDGAVVGSDTGTLSATNSWQDLTIATTSPADASYAVLYFAWDTTTTYYIDRVLVALDPMSAYEEARVTTIELAPQYENYIQNPSFEVDSTGWTITGATFSQDTDVPAIGYPGSSSGKFVGAGSWSLESDSHMTLENGIYFTVSHYLRSDDITQVDAFIDLYDADDTLIDTLQDTHTVTATWDRSYMTVLIPAGSTAAYCKYRLEAPAGTLYVDMVMAQDAYTPTDYIDGSLPELFGAIWEGTAHNSNTLYFPNKSTKFLRLAQTLIDWMPMNAWWRLTTRAGLEYTNLDV